MRPQCYWGLCIAIGNAAAMLHHITQPNWSQILRHCKITTTTRLVTSRQMRDAWKRSTSIWRLKNRDFPWVSKPYEFSDITGHPKKGHRPERKFKFWQSASSLSSLPSFVPMEFTTECKKYFHHYHTCSPSEILHLVATEIPQDQLPLAYLNSLSADNMTVCLRAIMICWVMSKMTMVPREMQLHVVLADVHAKDASVVAAGTGSGKTLPIALCILLDNPTANYLSITISLLKRLH